MTLTKEERSFLERVLRVRTFAAIFMLLSFGFLGVGTILPIFLGETLGALMYGFDVIYWIAFVWSIFLLYEARQSKKVLANLELIVIEGVPKKFGRGVAVPISSAPPLHVGMSLRGGTVHVQGKSYGVMLGLFSEIKNDLSGTFLVAPLKFGGISGVILRIL